MRRMVMAAGLFMAASAFAQWGDWGGGNNGGFGGPQNGSTVANAEKTADVNYVGDGKTYHTLDIYIPKDTEGPYPVVIHTYGSAWSMNNYKGSADLGTICSAYAKAGYAVVTPNHRSASDAKYPAQLHDIKAVVRFVRGNAAKYKFDTNFVAVSGFSSGGHLSSLTATTCGLKEGKSGSVTVDLVGDLGEYTTFSSCVDGAVLWSPPTDIYTMNPISMGGSGTMEGAFIGVEREGREYRAEPGTLRFPQEPQRGNGIYQGVWRLPWRRQDECERELGQGGRLPRQGARGEGRCRCRDAAGHLGPGYGKDRYGPAGNRVRYSSGCVATPAFAWRGSGDLRCFRLGRDPGLAFFRARQEFAQAGYLLRGHKDCRGQAGCVPVCEKVKHLIQFGL